MKILPKNLISLIVIYVVCMIGFFLCCFFSVEGFDCRSYERALSLATLLFWVIVLLITCIRNAYASRKLQKESLYKELQEYIDTRIRKIPELHGFSVKLHVDRAMDYNAHAFVSKIITISRAWYSSATMGEESKEYLKATINHELYHISRGHRIPVSYGSLLIIFAKHPVFLRRLRVKIGIIERYFSFIERLRDNYLLKTWKEEFEADRYGCRWYGNQLHFICKMKYAQKTNSGNVDTNYLSDHPTWDMRIRFIQEDIEPTDDAVEREYKVYREEFSLQEQEKWREKKLINRIKRLLFKLFVKNKTRKYCCVIEPASIRKLEAPEFGVSRWGTEEEYLSYLTTLQPAFEEYAATGSIYSFLSTLPENERNVFKEKFEDDFTSAFNSVRVTKHRDNTYSLSSSGTHRLYVAKKYNLKLLVYVMDEE